MQEKMIQINIVKEIYNMWPKYIVKDNFLNEEHFNLIKNISFDTKQDEWDIYKHKIYNDGKTEIIFASSSNKKRTSPLSEENIKNISDTYHDYMINCLKELAPEKLQHYWYTELNVVNNGKDYLFPIHSDSRDKLLSVVIYISPEKNEGTWLYEDKNGKNAKQVDWKTNRAFIFSRTDNTWHSYKADGINNRLALVYNLRSDKYWKK